MSRRPGGQLSINSLRVHVQYVYVLLILCIGIELGFYIFICMFLYTLLFFFALVFLPLTTVQARCAKKRFFLASICHANTDPPVTKIRLWASFGVSSSQFDYILQTSYWHRKYVRLKSHVSLP